ncbi:MAG: Fur family transcriptional regulator [Desulfatibacillaceae bacterium]
MDGSQLRMTRQRKVILEELADVTTHPTADQVYVLVRKRLPHISLATVYRNLEVLSEVGAIKKLDLGGTQRRYDGDTSEHHHVRCIHCQRVDDVPADACVVPDPDSIQVKGFEIIGQRLEFLGICQDCQQFGSPGQAC